MANCPECGNKMYESSSDDKFYFKCKDCHVTYGGYLKELKIICCNKRIFDRRPNMCVSCDWNNTCMVQKEERNIDKCASYKHEKDESKIDLLV